MKKLNIEQGSAEWMALRNNKIGASDAPVITGVSPWKTPYQLWNEKMGLVEKKDLYIKNEAMKVEIMARQKFIEEKGIEIFPAVALHDSIPFMMASFDGLSKCGKIVLEIKLADKDDHEKAMDGIVPEKYYPQLQQQAKVSETDSVFYLSWKNEKSYKILEIERNDRYIKDMIQKEEAFWECMQNLEAPDLIDRDYIKRDDDEWTNLAREWIELSKIEDRKDQVRKRLIDLSQKKNSMGAGIRLSKIPKKGNIDYKSIPILNGIDLEPYRKGTIETFRIGIC